MKRLAAVVSIMLVFNMIGTAVANAKPQLIECPNNTHVWAESRDECPELNPAGGFGAPRGGSGSGGLLGLIGDIIGGIF